MTTPREHLAWLMWCYAQGFTNPEDRAILTSWMGNDPATMHPEDAEESARLLVMADEILALLDGTTSPAGASNPQQPPNGETP